MDFLALSSMLLVHLPRRGDLDILVSNSGQLFFANNMFVAPIHTIQKAWLPAFLLRYSSFVAGPRFVLQASWVDLSRLYVPNWDKCNNTCRHRNRNGTLFWLCFEMVSTGAQQQLFWDVLVRLRLFSLIKLRFFTIEDYFHENGDKLEPLRPCILKFRVFLPRRVDIFGLYRP